MRRLVPLLALLAWVVPGPALAWSELGHWLVGELAGRQLSAGAQAEVRRLLAGEKDPTLAGVAGWADALRQSDPARFRETSRWHFINARTTGCGFDLARDCRDGQCVVAAIEQQRRILGDTAQPVQRRRDALKFIVHLVGDIHQPLHASDRNDAGGNRFQVQLAASPASAAQSRDGRRGAVAGTNLHAVWDYHLLASAGQGRDGLAARLRDAMSSLPAGSHGVAPAAATPLDWARESCALLNAEAIYPAGHVLDHRYLEAHRPLAERRIALAAARLAALLNLTLAAPR
jgi:nuclease S1